MMRLKNESNLSIAPRCQSSLGPLSHLFAVKEKLTALGLAIGLLGAFWLARLMKALVYGIGTADPATFAGTAALLAAVAIVACVIPARMAARHVSVSSTLYSM